VSRQTATLPTHIRHELRTTRAPLLGSVRAMPAEVASVSALRTQQQSRGLDEGIAELADRQHGVVGRTQLLNLGLESGAIGRRLRSGRLHQLHRGVYAVGHRAVSREGRWMAAVLACGSNAALSHRAAAALWGLRSPSGGPIDVTAPTNTRSRGAIHRHVSGLPADEVTVREGILVTTVPRTIFDLAAVLPATAVESALRQSEYLRLHDRLSLPDLLERYPRRHGSRAIRECLARRAEATGRTRSPLEDRFLPFLDQHHLPRPQLNAWLEAGRRRFQVDCLWSSRKQIVELDGWQGHSTRSAFREDRVRDRALRVAGYAVTRLTWTQLDDEPEAIAADLRALLGVGGG
jgi:very-short-patch-repair endonuclease/predicted transcriptional regulator of viral defense system